MILFGLGLFLGGVIEAASGVVVMAMMFVAKDADADEGMGMGMK